MAYVSDSWIVWQSKDRRKAEDVRSNIGTPDLDRVELNPGDTVPDIVDEDIAEEWLAKGLIHDDPNRPNIKVPAGPPNMLLPIGRPVDLPAQAHHSPTIAAPSTRNPFPSPGQKSPPAPTTVEKIKAPVGTAQ